MELTFLRAWGAFAWVAALCSAPIARADVDPVSGVDLVRVGAVGNAPWAGDGTLGDRAIGRGSVGYEYSIGKYEVTTAQWVEFFNAAFDRSDGPLPNLTPPTHWGAVSTTPNNPGGQRWRVPAGNEMMPVGNISWRMSAMLCNWYENHKSTDRSAFMNGAYDVSTFGYSGTTFTDQFYHNPGAHYWIPTWDEWLKAAHYDPNKNGPGEAGWWKFAMKRDTYPAYGPPGAMVDGELAQANAGWTSIDFPGYDPLSVPLGAYPNAPSPWGLLDAAGGSSEWTEEIRFVVGLYPTFRGIDGSSRITSTGPDFVNFIGAEYPSINLLDYGFRIASSVPAPGSCALAVGLLATCARRKRRSVCGVSSAGGTAFGRRLWDGTVI